MRTFIGLWLAATAAVVAVAAAGVSAAPSQKVVYHSKLRGGNNEILVVGLPAGRPRG